MIYFTFKEYTADFEDQLPKMIKPVLNRSPEINTEEEAEEFIRGVNSFDPTGEDGSYTFWLLKQIGIGEITEDDLPVVSEVLKEFDVLKRKNLWKEKELDKDINTYNYSTLVEIINSLKEEGAEVASEQERYETLVDEGLNLASSDVYDIVEVTTKEALMEVSKSTSWPSKNPNIAQEWIDAASSSGVPIVVAVTDRESLNGFAIYIHEKESLRNHANGSIDLSAFSPLLYVEDIDNLDPSDLDVLSARDNEYSPAAHIIFHLYEEYASAIFPVLQKYATEDVEDHTHLRGEYDGLKVYSFTSWIALKAMGANTEWCFGGDVDYAKTYLDKDTVVIVEDGEPVAAYNRVSEELNDSRNASLEMGDDEFLRYSRALQKTVGYSPLGSIIDDFKDIDADNLIEFCEENIDILLLEYDAHDIVSHIINRVDIDIDEIGGIIEDIFINHSKELINLLSYDDMKDYMKPENFDTSDVIYALRDSDTRKIDDWHNILNEYFIDNLNSLTTKYAQTNLEFMDNILTAKQYSNIIEFIDSCLTLSPKSRLNFDEDDSRKVCALYNGIRHLLNNESEETVTNTAKQIRSITYLDSRINRNFPSFGNYDTSLCKTIVHNADTDYLHDEVTTRNLGEFKDGIINDILSLEGDKPLALLHVDEELLPTIIENTAENARQTDRPENTKHHKLTNSLADVITTNPEMYMEYTSSKDDLLDILDILGTWGGRYANYSIVVLAYRLMSDSNVLEDSNETVSTIFYNHVIESKLCGIIESLLDFVGEWDGKEELRKTLIDNILENTEEWSKAGLKIEYHALDVVYGDEILKDRTDLIEQFVLPAHEYSRSAVLYSYMDWFKDGEYGILFNYIVDTLEAEDVVNILQTEDILRHIRQMPHENLIRLSDKFLSFIDSGILEELEGDDINIYTSIVAYSPSVGKHLKTLFEITPKKTKSMLYAIYYAILLLNIIYKVLYNATILKL